MKQKKIKKESINNGFNSAYFDMLREKALIESTGASLRLSGRKISDEQVAEMLEKIEE